ncbi:hypothetical protein EBZ80_11425 [bacterium]|nr:hypothetical protein [bacterium]
MVVADIAILLPLETSTHRRQWAFVFGKSKGVGNHILSTPIFKRRRVMRFVLSSVKERIALMRLLSQKQRVSLKHLQMYQLRRTHAYWIRMLQSMMES